MVVPMIGPIRVGRRVQYYLSFRDKLAQVHRDSHLKLKSSAWLEWIEISTLLSKLLLMSVREKKGE